MLLSITQYYSVLFSITQYRRLKTEITTSDLRFQCGYSPKAMIEHDWEKSLAENLEKLEFKLLELLKPLECSFWFAPTGEDYSHRKCIFSVFSIYCLFNRFIDQSMTTNTIQSMADFLPLVDFLRKGEKKVFLKITMYLSYWATSWAPIPNIMH